MINDYYRDNKMVVNEAHVSNIKSKGYSHIYLDIWYFPMQLSSFLRYPQSFLNFYFILLW